MWRWLCRRSGQICVILGVPLGVQQVSSVKTRWMVPAAFVCSQKNGGGCLCLKSDIRAMVKRHLFLGVGRNGHQLAGG